MREIRPNELTARAIIHKLRNASENADEGRLFFACIAQHVRDYCVTLSPRLIKAFETGKDYQSHRDALRFARDAERFFTTSSVFELYCDLIGLDADYARKIIFEIKRAQVEEFGVKEVAA